MRRLVLVIVAVALAVVILGSIISGEMTARARLGGLDAEIGRIDWSIVGDEARVTLSLIVENEAEYRVSVDELEYIVTLNGVKVARDRLEGLVLEPGASIPVPIEATLPAELVVKGDSVSLEVEARINASCKIRIAGIETPLEVRISKTISKGFTEHRSMQP